MRTGRHAMSMQLQARRRMRASVTGTGASLGGRVVTGEAAN
jgi:hypothetical protein